jgi:hypothetical protein
LSRKLNSWIKTSVFVFLCCITSFGIWIGKGGGEPNFALALSVVTFLLWGYATSKGFKIGIFKEDE